MKHRNRNTILAFLAAGLLVFTAMSTTLAFGGRQGGFGNQHPKVTVDPSHNHKASHSIAPKPTHAPKVVDCSKVPAATPTPAVTPTAGTAARPAGDRKTGLHIFDGWVRDFDKTKLQVCTVAALKSSADSRIGSYVKTLQALDTKIGKIAALTTAEKASLTGEVNGAIADLTALKTKIDAETTVAAIQADLAALSKERVYIRTIRLQVSIIAGAESILTGATALDAQATTFAASIAAAPAGIDTAAAQKYLDDLKANVAAARTLAAPLPASMLALTEAQLKAGRSDPTIAAAFKAEWRASFDIWKARHDAKVVAWILAGKPGFQGHHEKSPVPSKSPTATPTPTLAPTPTLVPTATPV
jgi:hypothetical protein